MTYWVSLRTSTYRRLRSQSLELLETNGHTVRGRVADFDAFDTIVKSVSGIATAVDLTGQVTLELIASGGEQTLDLVDALDDSGGRGVKITGSSDDETIVAGKLKENEIYGLEGNDELTGGDEKDKIEGGEGDDIIYGTKGDAETLDGGNGQDTFDFTGKDGSTAVSELTTGSSQTLKGGDNPSKSLVDTLELSGSANDYRFDVTIGGSWEGTKTSVVHLTSGGGTRVTLTTDQIEKATFEDPLDNSINRYLSNTTLEMAKSMVEVYGESTGAAVGRKWHAVSAMELGILPSDCSFFDRYTMKDGVYEDVLRIPFIANDAVATVVSEVVTGERTLSITFKGSDPTDVLDWAADLAQARGLFFKHYTPLMDAVKSYLANEGSDIQQNSADGTQPGRRNGAACRGGLGRRRLWRKN